MKLNVTPAEAEEIQREADACHRASRSPGYNHSLFTEFMRERFGVGPLCQFSPAIQMIVRKDVAAIPCPGVPRLEED